VVFFDVSMRMFIINDIANCLLNSIFTFVVYQNKQLDVIKIYIDLMERLRTCILFKVLVEGCNVF